MKNTLAGNVMEHFYKEISESLRGFNEELESEFNRIIKELNLPMDKQSISDAGINIERGENQLFIEDKAYPFTTVDQTAIITQYGKPISRVIKMNDYRIDSNCIDDSLKEILIKGGVLCPVLDDLKRMTSDACKTLQDLLDEPDRPDHNCTQIEVDPVTHKINRVVCFGIEYK